MEPVSVKDFSASGEMAFSSFVIPIDALESLSQSKGQVEAGRFCGCNGLTSAFWPGIIEYEP